MKARLALCAAVLAVGLGSISADAATGWTPLTAPTSVWAGYTNGLVFVDGLPNTAACSNALIEFSSSTSDPQKILSIATAALLSGKRLTCKVSNCTSGGYQAGYQCRLAH